MSHKLLSVFCALVLVLGLSFSTEAAVQNVKVGGDIQIRGIWQNEYDLNSSIRGPLGDVPTATNPANTALFVQTTALMNTLSDNQLGVVNYYLVQMRVPVGTIPNFAANTIGWTDLQDIDSVNSGEVGVPVAGIAFGGIGAAAGVSTNRLVAISILDQTRPGAGIGTLPAVTGLTAGDYNPSNIRARKEDTNNTPAPSDDASSQDWYDSVARVYVEASLTDNVTAHVRILSERDWDTLAGTGVDTVEVDLAYLTLGDVYGYPLSLTFGRQELAYGEGFLIGDGTQMAADTYQWDCRTSFDALKGVWMYEPHQIDVFVSKIQDGYFLGQDLDLYGANWNIDGGMYGVWDIGLFHTSQHTNNVSIVPGTVIYGDPGTGAADTLTTAGAAVTATPVNAPNGVVGDNLWEGDNSTTALSVRGEGTVPQITTGTLALKGEIVKEWGRVATRPYAYIQDPNNPTDLLAEGNQRTRDAWAGYVEGEYTFDNPYTPYLGLGYVFMTGDKNNDDSVIDNDGKIETFDPLFENVKYGEIADWVYGNMTNNRSWDGSTSRGMTNASIWKASFGVKPTENFLIDLTYYNFRTNRPEYNVLTQDNTSSDVGQEYDLSLSYDYTEDVSFGLLYAHFVPGKYWDDALLAEDFDDVARELLGSVKVTF